jgi:hypothetical protein
LDLKKTIIGSERDLNWTACSNSVAVLAIKEVKFYGVLASTETETLLERV